MLSKEKLQKKWADVGTDIHYAGSSLGSSIKHKVTGQKVHDADREMIDQCDHDLKQLSKGLQYSVSQTKRIATKYWPHVFLSSIKTTKLLLLLLGENSLNFKGIEEYYEKFDHLQSNAESFIVHPKERQSIIPSLLKELGNYFSTMTQMLERFKHLSEEHANRVRSKVDPIIIQIKHIRKAIAAKNKQKAKCDKLQWKADKLAKKSLRTDKDLQEFDELERKLEVQNDIYHNLNSRLKIVLPESLSLIEEFVAHLTSWFICHQHELYKQINAALIYFSTFYGFVSEIAHTNGLAEELIKGYDKIIEEWETQATPVRLQVESFLQVLYNKKPELLDKEIDDKEHKLVMSKAWSSVTTKVTTRLYKVKATEKSIGVFGEHAVADPLVLFKKYQDPQMNRSETYHPSRVLKMKDLKVEPQESKTPPPLPPRDENHRINLFQPQWISSPLSFSSVDLGEISDTADDTSSVDLMSFKSDTESDLGSLSSELTRSDFGATERTLVAIYNSRKNDIKRAPETHEKWTDLLAGIEEEKSSISRELLRLHEFFEKAVAHADEHGGKKLVVATEDFEGAKPGDISFKKGDQVEVVFDFQSLGVTYNAEGRNWFVGSVGPRIGFAPNTHFAWT